MEPIELSSGAYHLRDGSNMGLVVCEGRGLLVDAGLDADAARRALRVVEAMDIALEGVILTHAHADHFGGAHFLQRRLGVALYAPALEAAMMEHPILEPLFLFAGAAPIAELRRKFTLARACQIDHAVETGPLEIGPFCVQVVPLPGHSLGQVGVAVGDVLYCADAFFPQETLDKHKVIFCVDLDAAMDTLRQLPQLPYALFAPGHGPACAAGRQVAGVCEANRSRLQEVRELVLGALQEPAETSAIVRGVTEHLGLRLATATAYSLARTTVLSALSSLEAAGEVSAPMRNNRLLWTRTG